MYHYCRLSSPKAKLGLKMQYLFGLLVTAFISHSNEICWPWVRRVFMEHICDLNWNLSFPKSFGKIFATFFENTVKWTLLHGCFSRFLNCANATKSRNAPHMKTSIYILLLFRFYLMILKLLIRKRILAANCEVYFVGWEVIL